MIINQLETRNLSGNKLISTENYMLRKDCSIRSSIDQ